MGDKCGTYARVPAAPQGKQACRRCLRAHAGYVHEYRKRGKCAPGLGWPLVARRG